jgi:hypothetical protein
MYELENETNYDAVIEDNAREYFMTNNDITLNSIYLYEGCICDHSNIRGTHIPREHRIYLLSKDGNYEACISTLAIIDERYILHKRIVGIDGSIDKMIYPVFMTECIHHVSSMAELYNVTSRQNMYKNRNIYEQTRYN